MNLDDINDQLRETLRGLVEKGYKKTDIGKLLLGANGYSAMSKFIREDSDRIDIGIKPLSRIAEQADYTIQLCIVKKEDPMIEDMKVRSAEFFRELGPLVENYLNESYTDNMKKVRNSKTRQTLDELLSSISI